MTPLGVNVSNDQVSLDRYVINFVIPLKLTVCTAYPVTIGIFQSYYNAPSTVGFYLLLR